MFGCIFCFKLFGCLYRRILISKNFFNFQNKKIFTRYKYQAGGWSAAGHDGDNGIQQSNFVQHHEGWNRGEFWTSQERVSFERAKLTNKESQQGGNSMV